MRSSESLINLAPALVKAQHEFRVIERTADGQVGSRVYKYADLPGTLESVREILKTNGLAVVQLPGISEGKNVLATMILHESGEFIEGEMDLGSATASQLMGSAITYARRYSLGGALRLATEPDDDGAGVFKSDEARPDIDDLVLEMASVSPDPVVRRKFVLETLDAYPADVPSYAALDKDQVKKLRAAIKELAERPA